MKLSSSLLEVEIETETSTPLLASEYTPENLRKKEDDKVSFFFRYWILHRDLLTIIENNRLDILKKCIIRFSENKNPITRCHRRHLCFKSSSL